MRSRAWGAIAFATLAALAAVGMARTGAEAKAVDVEAVERKQVRASVLTSGTLVYERQSLLSPEVIGRVREVLVREGEAVEAGQLLLVLEEETFQAEVAQQRAAVAQQVAAVERHALQLSTQRRQAARLRELFEAQLVDAQRHEQEQDAVTLAGIALQSARGSLAQARAQLVQAEQRLARTAIRAPMAGVVVALSIKPGETAVPSASGIAGSSLLTIADPASLVTEVNVDEADIARVRTGQDAALFAAGDPDTAVPARVRDIALTPRQPSPLSTQGATRDYTVRLELGRGHEALRPGMSCRAEIYTRSAQSTLAVPLMAVFSNNTEAAAPGERGSARETEHFVFVERDGRAERRVVQLGLADDEYQEISHGVALGDRIVTGPYKLLRHLKPGDLVAATLKGIAP